MYTADVNEKPVTSTAYVEPGDARKLTRDWRPFPQAGALSLVARQLKMRVVEGQAPLASGAETTICVFQEVLVHVSSVSLPLITAEDGTVTSTSCSAPMAA